MSAPITSEARVPVIEDQVVTFEMLTNMGIFAQGSLDNAIGLFLNGGVGYQGLQCSISTDTTKNTASLITIAPGFFVRGGVVYPLRDAAELDLSDIIRTVPDSTKSAIVLILADGGEADVDAQISVLDEAQKPSDPNAYWPTKKIDGDQAIVRQMNPTRRWGDAALQPQAPSYPSSYCLIATAIVDNGSIVSLRQETSTQITRQDQLALSVAQLLSSTAGYGTAISGLVATVAGMKSAYDAHFLKNDAELASVQQQLTALGNQLALLGAGQATPASPSTTLIVTDFYTDGTGLTLQPNNPGYTVGTGLGFPTNAGLNGFAPVNGYSGLLSTDAFRNGKLCPAYSEVVLSETTSTVYQPLNVPGTSDGGVAFNVLPNFTAARSGAVNILGMGVERVRYGASFPAQATAYLQQYGDPGQLFSQPSAPLAYSQAWPSWTGYKPELNHGAGFYKDLSTRGYWGTRAPGVLLDNVPGIIQRMVPDNDQMMTSFELSVARGTRGDIRMLVVQPASDQSADLTQVIADVTVPYANINPEGEIAGYFGSALFKMPYPIYERAGKLLLYLFVTNGDHKFRLHTTATNTGTYTLGSFLQVAPGGFQAPGLAINGGFVIELMHRKKIAQFQAGSTDVQLQPLVQPGGFDTIDMLTPAVVPDGCDIGYKMQQPDGTLRNLGPITAAAPNMLAGKPQSVNLYASLIATAQTAPVIDLGTSGANASGLPNSGTAKQGGTLTAESAVRSLTGANGQPVGFTKIGFSCVLAGFNPGGTALETFGVQLETGANFATQTPPMSQTAPLLQPDGTYTATFSWTLGAAVTSFKLAYAGTTADTTQTFKMPKSVTTATP